ncbi:MAG: cation-translocating P-type ATPase [Phycisphaeraceae bacterium]|nr:cation-translocating P-type ATPase [Phycisphaeraceae bacterium]
MATADSIELRHQHEHTHSHEQGPSRMTCCAHHEMGNIEKWMFWYLVGGVLVLTTVIAGWFGRASGVMQIPALIGALFLGAPLFWAAITEVRQRRVGSSALVAIAILAAIATEEYTTAGILAFILLIADQFVRHTAFGAQRAIEELVQLTPDTARVIDEAGAESEVSLGAVQVGMTVRIRPGENLPVDGVVRRGRSTINQASLTGEAVPIEVASGDPVYAGTTNLTGQIDVEATLVGGETTIGKVTKLIREAEDSRTPRQLLIEQVARFFVPVALAVAAVVWFINARSPDAADKAEAARRAITVLIVSCPAALLLASPSAMVAAFASAARLGILVKQTNYLETAANVDAVVFDKTGTITTGRFGVAKLAPADGIEGADLLRAAANGEQHSNHPLAQSILTTAKAARIEPDGSSDFEEVHGRGVRAQTTMGEVCVGRASWLVELKPEIRDQVKGVEGKIEGMTGVHVMLDGRYMGVVGLEDKVRAGSKAVVQELRDMGVRSVAIFTGDRLSVAKRVGVAVGVDAIEAECLPEEKHQQIVALSERGYRTMMVGDGINDGPSLAAADVGVAMGLSGSDIATNSAGVALMTDDLNRIPFLIQLARRTRGIIGQNVAASILIVIVGLILASTGLLQVWFAALYHFVGEVFVLGNSFRLFRFGEGFAEAEEAATQRQKFLHRREASVRGLAPKAQPA